MNLIGAALGGLLLALAAACPAQRSATIPTTQAVITGPYSVQGSLAQQEGNLEYRDESASTSLQLPSANPLPYQVISQGSLSLTTTCDTGLNPSTYAIGPTGHISTYPGWLPMIVQNPLVALIPTASSTVDTGLGIQLLSSDGKSVYRNDNAALLTPANPTAWDIAYLLDSSTENDLIFPYGDDPTLVAVDPVSGKQQWRANLDPQAKVADAQLWAELEGQLLIVLQYDYLLFEFLSIDRTDGAVLQRWMLNGLPGGENVYPGPVWVPFTPDTEGTHASLIVYDDNAAAWQRWTFGCTDGDLVQEDCEPPELLREENSLPVGGTTIPSPGSAPFPQRLLPPASGASWKIDALTDSTGHVLVVDDSGAHWVKVEDALS